MDTLVPYPTRVRSFAIGTDGCAEHDGERQPADDLGQRYPGAEQVEEEIFQHPAEPWRPIATPEQSTPGSSDGSWTCIAATLARKQFGAAGGAELPQAPSASLISSPTAATASKIGRASCRGRGCQYVVISVVAVSLKQKKKNKKTTEDKN